MSDHDENKSSQSWFKAATLCVAFACVAGPALADVQPVAGKAVTVAADAKTEHRKLLERQIDLTSALATLAGTSPEAIATYRADETSKLDQKATGKADAMKRDAANNRKLELNILQMNKALAVSRA